MNKTTTFKYYRQRKNEDNSYIKKFANPRMQKTGQDSPSFRLKTSESSKTLKKRGNGAGSRFNVKVSSNPNSPKQISSVSTFKNIQLGIAPKRQQQSSLVHKHKMNTVKGLSHSYDINRKRRSGPHIVSSPKYHSKRERNSNFGRDTHLGRLFDKKKTSADGSLQRMSSYHKIQRNISQRTPEMQSNYKNVSSSSGFFKRRKNLSNRKFMEKGYQRNQGEVRRSTLVRKSSNLDTDNKVSQSTRITQKAKLSGGLDNYITQVPKGSSSDSFPDLSGALDSGNRKQVVKGSQKLFFDSKSPYQRSKGSSDSSKSSKSGKNRLKKRRKSDKVLTKNSPPPISTSSNHHFSNYSMASTPKSNSNKNPLKLFQQKSPKRINSVNNNNKKQHISNNKNTNNSSQSTSRLAYYIKDVVACHSAHLQARRFNQKTKGGLIFPQTSTNSTKIGSALHVEASEHKVLSKLFNEHFKHTLMSVKLAMNISKVKTSELNARKQTIHRHLQDKGRKTLVLDLDETLIHCNTQAGSGCDVSIPVTFPNGEVIKAPINLRPHVRQFLQEMASIFEVIVFTASHSCYADQVIDYLDPTRSLIRHRFYRESCIQLDSGVRLLPPLRPLIRQSSQPPPIGLPQGPPHPREPQHEAHCPCRQCLLLLCLPGIQRHPRTPLLQMQARHRASEARCLPQTAGLV